MFSFHFQISVKLIYDTTHNLYALVPRESEDLCDASQQSLRRVKKYSRHAKDNTSDTATNSVIVKCEEPYSVTAASHLETEETATLYSQQIPKRCLSTAAGEHMASSACGRRVNDTFDPLYIMKH